MEKADKKYSNSQIMQIVVSVFLILLMSFVFIKVLFF